VAERRRLLAPPVRRSPCTSRLWLVCAFLAFSHFAAAENLDESPRHHVIIIEGMRFNPPTLTVHRGDRITWTNKDLFPHTATANSKAFDSPSIAPNASWSYTVHRSGSYGYICRFHPTMQGTLIVQ
jgi:plastocyanin